MPVSLKIQGVTQLTRNNIVSLLVLTDLAEKRQITVSLTPSSSRNIVYRLTCRHTTDDSTRREMKKCLPEVLLAVLDNVATMPPVIRISLYDIDNGQYKARLTELTTGLTLPIEATEGITLAMILDDDKALNIDDDLWEQQSVPFFGPQVSAIAMPLNTLPRELIQEAMNQCIAEERYEMAAKLKEELEKREKEEEAE